jgi:hypothetical protein
MERKSEEKLQVQKCLGKRFVLLTKCDYEKKERNENKCDVGMKQFREGREKVERREREKRVSTSRAVGGTRSRYRSRNKIRRNEGEEAEKNEEEDERGGEGEERVM